MWKKWTFAAITYLAIVMAGYGIFTAIIGPEPNPSPSHQEEMKGE